MKTFFLLANTYQRIFLMMKSFVVFYPLLFYRRIFYLYCSIDDWITLRIIRNTFNVSFCWLLCFLSQYFKCCHNFFFLAVFKITFISLADTFLKNRTREKSFVPTFVLVWNDFTCTFDSTHCLCKSICWKSKCWTLIWIKNEIKKKWKK